MKDKQKTAFQLNNDAGICINIAPDKRGVETYMFLFLSESYCCYLKGSPMPGDSNEHQKNVFETTIECKTKIL